MKPISFKKLSPAEIAAERFVREIDERFAVPPVGMLGQVVSGGLEEESREREDGGANIPGIYNPSGGWKCFRQAAYEFFKYHSAKRLPYGLFRVGTIDEMEIERLLRKKYGRFISNDFPVLILIIDAGEHYEIEVPYPGDPNPDFTTTPWTYKGRPIVLLVRGYSDFYLQGYNGKVRVMWEGKSTARVGAKKEPSEHHVKQLAPYWKASRAQSARVAYYARADIDDLLELEVDPEELELAFQESMEWFIQFHQYVMQIVEGHKGIGDIPINLLPPAEPKDPDWECRYCGFVDQCRKDGGKPRV